MTCPARGRCPRAGSIPAKTRVPQPCGSLRRKPALAHVEVLAEAPEWLKYDLPGDLQKRAWKGKWRGQRQKWFAVRFLGQDAEIDILGVDKPEFARWRWVHVDDVPSLIVDFKRPVYEAVIEAFRPVLKQ